MKKLIATTIFSAVLMGCADTYVDQGVPPGSEENSASSTNEAIPPLIEPVEPGVAPAPGTRPAIDSSEATYPTPTPSKPVESLDEAQPVTPEGSSQDLNEQGTQITPEPETGDDANPDSVNPRSY